MHVIGVYKCTIRSWMGVVIQWAWSVSYDLWFVHREKMGNNFSEYTFNVGHGYLEGLLRGFKSGILDRTDYLNLVQCETIEGTEWRQFPSPVHYHCAIDLKMQLAATDYGNFLQHEPSPIPVTVLDEKLKHHLVVQFRYLRAHSVAPLSTFLDYIT